MESPESIALSDGPFRLGLATVSQLALHPEFDDKLAALIRRDGGPKRAVRALRREFLGEGLIKTITVPEDTTAESLVAETKAAFEREGIPFGYFNDDVLSCTRVELKLVKGKTLQVLTYTFEREWTTAEARDLQDIIGFNGNVAAFLIWVIQTKRIGWSVSISWDDKKHEHRQLGRFFRAPYFRRDEHSRDLYMSGSRIEWKGKFMLVAFREV